MKEKIILASGSPRRKQLLEWAEVPFEIVVRETAETYPADMAIGDIPVYIARQKALAVKAALSENNPSGTADVPILAADTVVVLEDRIIGKPADKADAVRTLLALSGRNHQVITGVVICYGNREIAFQETTEVRFHPLSRDQIEYYVEKYQPYDKAGAYAIQEWIGVTGIAAVKGDFYNVMGLPVSRVVQALKDLFSAR